MLYLEILLVCDTFANQWKMVNNIRSDKHYCIISHGGYFEYVLTITQLV